MARLVSLSVCLRAEPDLSCSQGSRIIMDVVACSASRAAGVSKVV